MGGWVDGRIGAEQSAEHRLPHGQRRGAKEQVALRIDREVLAAFRAAGPGWQTRMNDGLKDWLRTHPAA
ncbi:hypothetical protein C6568_10260 [Melaminivora suipulveris]|uniref:BrnA antitoxin family protein n=1 Tax=Melaminivora suipulveris TaxID=2109913 RepID=A0A2R3QCW3_9BURK|nr:hypothetical protein C6568_10260 [Melaminivora suipulveris]